MQLMKLSGAIRAAAASAVSDACDEVCQTAKALCPIESGELKASIDAAAEAGDGGAAGTVSASAAHAAFVELGTMKQSAQPYLQPALSQMKGRLAGMVADRIRAGL